MKDYDSFVHRLTKTKLGCGKSLTELTTYQGLPLLLFANFRFHSFMSKLVEEKNESARNALVWVTYKAVEPILGVFKAIFAEFALKLYGRKQKDDSHQQERIPKILFTSENLEWRIVRAYGSDYLKKTDAFFDSIISESGRRFKYLGVYPIGLSTLGLRVFIDKLRNWEIPYRPFRFLLVFELASRRSKRFPVFQSAMERIEQG